MTATERHLRTLTGIVITVAAIFMMWLFCGWKMAIAVVLYDLGRALDEGREAI